MDVKIKKIEKEYIEGFCNAVNSVAAEKKYILTLEPHPFEKMEAFANKNIDNNYAQYVALLDGQVIGWADIVPHSYSTMAHVGQLGMGVLNEYRGQGIGRKLLSAVVNHAFESGLTRLELEVFSDNHIAISLYESMGFKTEGEKINARMVDGEYQNISIMAKFTN